jgi:hypothetical protein
MADFLPDPHEQTLLCILGQSAPNRLTGSPISAVQHQTPQIMINGKVLRTIFVFALIGLTASLYPTPTAATGDNALGRAPTQVASGGQPSVMTTQSSPAEGGATRGDGTYNTGTSVTVFAAPNLNYSFANWTENGAQASASASYTFTVSGNRTLVANFAPDGGGTWTPLVRRPPSAIQLLLLLSDGTVMAKGVSGGDGNEWYRLTPDIHGSYVNGTWTTLSPMHDTRLYFSSQVVADGRVFVAGGEYPRDPDNGIIGRATAEIYDPVANSWTRIDPPTSLLDPSMLSPIFASNFQAFADSVSEILPNGRVLVAPVAPNVRGGTLEYDPTTNVWSAGPILANNVAYQDEASWVKLPDRSILTIDPFGTNSERFIPSTNTWIPDSDVPVELYDPFGGELGAGFLLPNGKAFFIGSTGHTAIYTPSGTTNPGAWAAGSDIPNSQGTPDAAAAMMVNGRILCAVSPLPTSGNHFPPPTSFYEYDYVANSFTQVSAPTGSIDDISSYITLMLDLPDGTVLYSHFGDQLYDYAPTGAPLNSGKPTIFGIQPNADSSYHLTGTLLNGISEGAAYGDDNQMASNYPLVRLTASNGNVYYARTYNWSSTGVMTGNTQVSTEFRLPAGLPSGTYSLVAVANGIASNPVSFNPGASPSPTPPATPTATPFVTPTPTPTTTPCGGSANVIADGGFESGGIPSTIWNSPQSSTNFGTPLCDVATCGNGGGASPPRSGSIWVWFGGIAAPETAMLGQNVIIPSGGSAMLNFWMRVGTVSAPFTDVLNVRVDGAIVQSYSEPSVTESDYTLRTINLNAFANGAVHNIEFEYVGPSTGTGSYVVDDVSLIVGDGCATPNPSPSATVGATPTPTAAPTTTPCGGTVFSQNFDGVTAPALPAGWVATNPVVGNGILWVTSTTNPYTSPNVAFIPDQIAISDKVLDTPGIAISSTSAQLSFRNNFDTEFSDGTYWDGGVIEVSSPNINGGAFTDVTDPAVGGSFVSGGYTGFIDSTAGCPLAGRMAWSGNSGGYVSTVVNLGPNVNGQTIKLRFRMATDEAVSASGWRIDALSVVNGCATSTTLGNISTRLRVETGNNVLIGGFIITGTQPKRVIVRAIGPSLPFAGALSDPVLELHGPGSFATITNDDWRSDQEAEIIATTIPPSNNFESAIVATLPANNSAYTAIVHGFNNGTGIGVVEAYDLNQAVDSKLANISTRGLVQTGDNVMIGGLIVLGQTPLRVLVRAIGPSLPVAGALGNPTLELRDGNGGLIDSNDNWRSDHEAEIIATGIPPSNDLESAIVRNLTPGNYTAIVRGVGNTTGVGLVEAYGLN